MKTVLAIVTAGIPGVLSYWLLSNFGIINYNKNENIEKASTFAFFSFLNLGFGLALYDYISRNSQLWIHKYADFPLFPFPPNLLTPYFNLAICTLTVTIFMSIVVYPICYKAFSIIYSYIIDKFKLNKNSNMSVLESAIKKHSKLDARVYIFDFQNNFIETGEFARISDYDEEYFVSLRNETGYAKETFTFSEVMSYYNSEEVQNNKPEIVLDLKNKYKFIIIYP